MEKSTEVNIELSDKDFIGWSINRLKYLHGYTDDNYIIERLFRIQNRIGNYEYGCEDENLDRIISQYFIDFFLIKDEGTDIGYTDQERINLRNAIKKIIEDVLDNNIPKEITLK
jgi:hypothetical protein